VAVGSVVEVGRVGAVAVVTVTRGKVNAVDVELLDELQAVVDSLGNDDEVRAVVLTGAGRAFSAGVDLPRVLDGGAAYAEHLIAGLRRVFETLFAFPKPTVAAVNGAAVAGGCIVACACDRRLMAQGARIGASELVVGVPFPASAIEVVRHACGPRTEDVVFTGALFDAAGAVAVGMVHEVHAPDTLLERAVAVAGELGEIAPAAYRLAKEQLRRPALQRMRRDAAAVDAEVAREWAAPHTHERLRRQLERLAARR